MTSRPQEPARDLGLSPEAAADRLSARGEVDLLDGRRDRLPAQSAPLLQVLGPPAQDPWPERHGVERFLRLGRWLKAVHATPPEEVGAHPAEPDVADVARDGMPGPVRDLLDQPLVTTLESWAQTLGDGTVLCHGSLGLDAVLVGAVDQPLTTVVPAAGMTTAHPAADLGWVLGDLYDLVELARHRGEDEQVYQRLAAAFLTGYRGLMGRGLEDAQTTRAAAALRIVSRLADDAEADRPAEHEQQRCTLLGRLAGAA